MNSSNKTKQVRPSVLDRLIDESVDVNTYTIDLLLEAIRRDLENLLNTPRSPQKFGPEFRELSSSILNFGIKDISSISGSDRNVWDIVVQDVRHAIELYEPRLKNVRVELKHFKDKKMMSKVEFEIHGQLVFEPSPELVFQSTIQLSNGRTLVDFPDLSDTVN